MHVLILRPYRKDNIYFRTIEEREKISALSAQQARGTNLDKNISGKCLLLILVTKTIDSY